MNRGEKIRHRKTMKALDRAKTSLPIWEPQKKVGPKIVGWRNVTIFKRIHL